MTADIPTHEIVWTHERDHIEANAICNDDECLNRYVCSEGDCEVYYDVLRGDDGKVTHAQWDDGTRAIIERHRMEKSDSCNLVDFLNADTDILPELAVDTDRFEIGRTPIEAVWQDEGALWKRVTS